MTYNLFPHVISHDARLSHTQAPKSAAVGDEKMGSGANAQGLRELVYASMWVTLHSSVWKFWLQPFANVFIRLQIWLSEHTWSTDLTEAALWYCTFSSETLLEGWGNTYSVHSIKTLWDMDHTALCVQKQLPTLCKQKICQSLRSSNWRFSTE